MSGQLHDSTHTEETCGECQRAKATGEITIHYWVPIEEEE